MCFSTELVIDGWHLGTVESRSPVVIHICKLNILFRRQHADTGKLIVKMQPSETNSQPLVITDSSLENSYRYRVNNWLGRQRSGGEMGMLFSDEIFVFCCIKSLHLTISSSPATKIASKCQRFRFCAYIYLTRTSSHTRACRCRCSCAQWRSAGQCWS